MYQNGHYGAALLAYAPVGFAVTAAGFYRVGLAGGAVAVALATLPDCDIRLSVLDHRGLTHTVWFALLVGLVVGATGALLGTGGVHSLALAGFGFLVGTVTVCSHIAADSITPMGVQPYAPLSERHISYDVVPAKHTVANWLLLVAGTLAAGGAVVLARGVG